MSRLTFGRDTNSFNAYAPMPSNNKWSATLADGTASSVTVPSTHETWIVSFRYQPGSDVWIDVSGATAAIPAGVTFAVTTSELNPASLTLPEGAVISAITADTEADVSIVMWPASFP